MFEFLLRCSSRTPARRPRVVSGEAELHVALLLRTLAAHPISTGCVCLMGRCITAAVKRLAQHSSIYAIVGADGDDPVPWFSARHAFPTAISTRLPTT